MNLKLALETRPHPIPEPSLLEPDPLYIELRREPRPAPNNLAADSPPKPHDA